MEVFHENKQWFLSTQKYEPLNKFLTCVVGLPGPDGRFLASTLQFMLPVQSPLQLNRWKLIHLIKLLQLTETLSASPCCEAGRALGFLHFRLHTLCTLDICTQEVNQIKNFLLECLPFKVQWLLYVSPDSTFRNPTFSPYKVFMHFVWISEQWLFPYTTLFPYTALTEWFL